MNIRSVTIQQVLMTAAQDVQAAQIGVSSGTLIGSVDSIADLALRYVHRRLVHGVRAERDILAVIRNFAHFFAHESCGFCTPCRVARRCSGTAWTRSQAGAARNMIWMRCSIGMLIKRRSHCGLGQTAANPILTVCSGSRTYSSSAGSSRFVPHFDLDAALEEARRITHRDDAAAHLK